MVRAEVSVATPEHAAGITSIYRSCFPRSFRSRAGQRFCKAYFARLSADPAYRVLVATDGGDVLGFACLHTDRLASLSFGWERSLWPELAPFVLRHPRLIARRVLNVLRRRLRRRVHLQSQSGVRDEFRRSAYLDDIAVAESARGRGVGSALLEACADETNRLGLSMLMLTVDEENVGAIRLYQRMGFEKRGMNRKHRTRIYARCLG